MPERTSRRPSFADAYEQHVWSVYGFFAYRLGSRHDAEDLTQLTFERALKAWPRYDPRRAAPGTWLLTIARNLLVDHHRAAKSVPTADPDPGTTRGGPELEVGLDADLERALAGLSPREREVVALRFGADMTGPEIAEMTDSNLASVQQALSRALRRMRAHLDEAGADPAALRPDSSR